MSIGLATLVARLQGAVPALNGAPSSEQYSQCVEDAVADYSAARPLQRVTTIDIVAGTATYSLPADWQRTIRLAGLLQGAGVLITAEGLIPVASDFQELITYAGQTLTITPTPAYTLTRELYYAANYVLDEHEVYADLTTEDARVALLKAQALALQLQANTAAQAGWKYQLADEAVDKSGLAGALRAQAASLEQAYQAALRQKVQPYGVRG